MRVCWHQRSHSGKRQVTDCIVSSSTPKKPFRQETGHRLYRFQQYTKEAIPARDRSHTLSFPAVHQRSHSGKRQVTDCIVSSSTPKKPFRQETGHRLYRFQQYTKEAIPARDRSHTLSFPAVHQRSHSGKRQVTDCIVSSSTPKKPFRQETGHRLYRFQQYTKEAIPARDRSQTVSFPAVHQRSHSGKRQVTDCIVSSSTPKKPFRQETGHRLYRFQQYTKEAIPARDRSQTVSFPAVHQRSHSGKRQVTHSIVSSSTPKKPFRQETGHRLYRFQQYTKEAIPARDRSQTVSFPAVHQRSHSGKRQVTHSIVSSSTPKKPFRQETGHRLYRFQQYTKEAIPARDRSQTVSFPAVHQRSHSGKRQVTDCIVSSSTPKKPFRQETGHRLYRFQQYTKEAIPARDRSQTVSFPAVHQRSHSGKRQVTHSIVSSSTPKSHVWRKKRRKWWKPHKHQPKPTDTTQYTWDAREQTDMNTKVYVWAMARRTTSKLRMTRRQLGSSAFLAAAITRNMHRKGMEIKRDVQIWTTTVASVFT